MCIEFDSSNPFFSTSILIVHAQYKSYGSSSSLQGQNAIAKTVPAAFLHCSHLVAVPLNVTT